eukprot:TRINITY_DN517_c0_g1_i1.p1 TRINITY_DN517_c0_g1~~TRINITY_DN517_c0_g1_i1.p1  ORF type:complete len:205 (+),score=55.82 TRINITY_DN517_c0_g1_i1:44-616(+)
MFAFIVVVVVATFLASGSAICVDPATPGPGQFTLVDMLGGWHQIYANELTYLWLERDTVCVQAHYKLNANGTVGVNNTALHHSPQGSVDQILGWAAQTAADTHPARLKVHLQGVPFAAPLWWLATSDNSTGRYEWAVGSDDFCATLFVIARTIPLSAKHQQQVEAALAVHDWHVNDLVKIDWSGCPPLIP